ncbi:hypothetical protein ACVRYP_06450, partial [Streptococcus rifensis]
SIEDVSVDDYTPDTAVISDFDSLASATDFEASIEDVSADDFTPDTAVISDFDSLTLDLGFDNFGSIFDIEAELDDFGSVITDISEGWTLEEVNPNGHVATEVDKANPSLERGLSVDDLSPSGWTYAVIDDDLQDTPLISSSPLQSFSIIPGEYEKVENLIFELDSIEPGSLDLENYKQNMFAGPVTVSPEEVHNVPSYLSNSTRVPSQKIELPGASLKQTAQFISKNSVTKQSNVSTINPQSATISVSDLHSALPEGWKENVGIKTTITETKSSSKVGSQLTGYSSLEVSEEITEKSNHPFTINTINNKITGVTYEDKTKGILVGADFHKGLSLEAEYTSPSGSKYSANPRLSLDVLPKIEGSVSWGDSKRQDIVGLKAGGNPLQEGLVGVVSGTTETKTIDGVTNSKTTTKKTDSQGTALQVGIVGAAVATRGQGLGPTATGIGVLNSLGHIGRAGATISPSLVPSLIK